MAYDFLDWAVMWKIDRMVPLSSAQRDLAKSEVRDLHQWHRETQLPRYIEYLEGVQQRLQPGSITGEQLHAETDQMQLMLDDVLEKVLPRAVPIISDLSDDQVTAMLDNIAEERQEYIEENIEPGEAKRQEKNATELKDHLKRFVGRLTKEQEQWIDEWSKQLQPYARLSAEQQALWQEHLAKYLELRDNQELLAEGLRELMLYRTDNWQPELQKVMDANQEMTYDLVAKILNNLTPKQHEHVQKRMQGYISDFRQLAQK